jgi:hypothetical protein
MVVLKIDRLSPIMIGDIINFVLENQMTITMEVIMISN